MLTNRKWTADATILVNVTKGDETIVDGYVYDNGIEMYGEAKGYLKCDDKKIFTFEVPDLATDFVETYVEEQWPIRRSFSMRIDDYTEFQDLCYDIEDFYANDITDYGTDAIAITNEIRQMLRDAINENLPSTSDEPIIEAVSRPPLY